MKDARIGCLIALSLVSGMGSIVYEVLYMRHLTTALGDMFYVHAALLSVFLFGIGLGARLAHHCVRQLPAFELAIGAYAIAFPWIAGLYLASPLATAIDDPVASTVCATLALLLFPATAIGFSIPLFSAWIHHASGRADAFKLTYLLYNVGAFLSILIADFALIRALGYRHALTAVASLNLLCAAGLWWQRARWCPPATTTDDGAPVDGAPVDRRTAISLLLASLAAAAFQGFYLKVCYHLFLPHRENFALCTAVVLLAIALGTQLVRRTGLRYETSLLGAAVSITAVYALWPGIAASYQHLAGPDLGWLQIVLKLAAAGLLGGVPYLFLGATVPALLRDETGRGVASASGRLLFLCGCGNAAGFLVYMFVVHPLLPLFGGLIALVALLLLARLIRGLPPRPRPVAVAALVLLALAMIGVARTPADAVYLVHNRWETGDDARVLHVKSASDNVSFVTTPQREFVTYNGHPSIYVTHLGRTSPAELVSGLVPALVAPRRERALVIGLGTGMTGGTMARLFDQTDIVEINAAFFRTAPLMAHANFGVSDNPAARLIHDDGRRYLAHTTERYDAVVNATPSPTYYSAGKVFTVEYFQRVKRVLRDGGVFCTWFTGGDMSTAGIDTLVASLRTVFRHGALVILRRGYYYAVCSDAPIRAAALADIGAPAAVREALAATAPYADLDLVVRSLFVSDQLYAGMRPGVPLNRDLFPVLEFQIMTQRRKRSTTRDPVQTDRFPLSVRVPDDPAAFIESALVYAHLHPRIHERLFAPRLADDPALRARYAARVERLFPADPEAFVERALLYHEHYRKLYFSLFHPRLKADPALRDRFWQRRGASWDR